MEFGPDFFLSPDGEQLIRCNSCKTNTMMSVSFSHTLMLMLIMVRNTDKIFYYMSFYIMKAPYCTGVAQKNVFPDTMETASSDHVSAGQISHYSISV